MGQTDWYVSASFGHCLPSHAAPVPGICAVIAIEIVIFRVIGWRHLATRSHALKGSHVAALTYLLACPGIQSLVQFHADMLSHVPVMC